MRVPTTLVTQIQGALLALPDEVLAETIEHWLLPLYEQCDDFEVICDHHKVLGYRTRSILTGYLYGSFEELSEAEPETVDFSWVAPEIQTLRDTLRVMQADQFYHWIVVLAGEALSQKLFTWHWGAPPGDNSPGEAFLQAFLGYLILRQEAASLPVEQFERQHREQLEALAIPEQIVEEDSIQELSDGPSTERQWHIRIEFATTNEEQQRIALDLLRHYGIQFRETSDANVKEGAHSYRPWYKDDLKALARARRFLRRWQARGRLSWAEWKTKPPRRTPSRCK